MYCTLLTSSQKHETDLWSASVLILCQLCSEWGLRVFKCVWHKWITAGLLFLPCVSWARPTGLRSPFLFLRLGSECQEGKVMDRHGVHAFSFMCAVSESMPLYKAEVQAVACVERHYDTLLWKNGKFSHCWANSFKLIIFQCFHSIITPFSNQH